MAIQAGSTIRADDFVDTSSGSADEGKVPKLDENGQIPVDFLPISQQSSVVILPKPEISTSGALASVQMNSNTTAFVGLIDIPYEISANVVFIRKTSLSTSGNFKLALFTPDGQTKILEETIATGSGTGLLLYQLATQTTIPAGKYYVMIVPVSTTDFNSSFYTTQSAGTLGSDSLYSDGGSAFALEGTLTVTAGTIPSTFDPTNINAVANRTLAFRLGNITNFTYTSSGTWTAPAGVTSILVQCWGGGGGGRNGNGAGGRGGGGGAYSEKIVSVTPGNSYTVTVGNGGGANTDGGDSWFDSTGTVLAKGGQAGQAAAGGTGGQASSGVGTTKYSGGNGVNADAGGGGGGAGTTANGSNGSGSSGGSGGSLYGGNGGSNPGGGASGNPGSVRGGGGAGGYNGAATSGGSGGRGEVRIIPQ